MRTGMVAAGVYAAVLGPTGALAQDPTPEPTSAPTEQPTPAPTQTAAPEPTQTATPDPTATPQETPPTPVASPEPTPTAMPSPTPTPAVDAQADPTATPGSSQTVAPTGAHEDEHADEHADEIEIEPSTLPECIPGGAVGEVGASEAGLGGDGASTKKKASTSARGSECRKAIKKAVEKAKRDTHAKRLHNRKPPAYRPDGTPTLDNPTVSLSSPGAAPIGVPNFFIEKFRIPPFLLPIYQAAGMEYGINWEVLAAINEIETDYGRNLNVSYAGALGWMQFMPATWEAYGVDANRDGVRDPYNPVDAIFAAARYLKAAGAETDLRKAIFAYNHADWYVDSVIMRARLISGLPSNFVGSLTGLTQARFPVYAKSRYAGSLDTATAGKQRMAKGANAAIPVESSSERRGIRIFADRGAPAIAVNDGKIIRIGRNDRLGRYVALQDVHGNVFTYAHLGKVAKTYPSPRPRRIDRDKVARELDLPKGDAAPTAAASATTRADARARKAGGGKATRKAAKRPAPRPRTTDPLAAATKERLFAHPSRPAARAAGGEAQLAQADYKPSKSSPLQLNSRDYVAKPLRKGARVIAGTELGRIGRTNAKLAPHVLFEIRPAGRGAPRIDPKPILDGWKLLESTEIYRAAGKNPFFGPDAKSPSIGQILLMSKQALQKHVLENPRVEIYDCGRRDVRIGAIDRRVLATIAFLAGSGLKPTVTSLQCGHGYYTASGNVSAHSSGNAVDIAAINGIPITGHQGKGSITEMAIQRLLTLQGTMKPQQIISLMTFAGTDNTFAMGDHHDHIHVGFRPMYGTNSQAAKEMNAVLKPEQWIKLIDRLGEIDNPTVRRNPSKYALKVYKRDRKAGRPTD